MIREGREQKEFSQVQYVELQTADEIREALSFGRKMFKKQVEGFLEKIVIEMKVRELLNQEKRTKYFFAAKDEGKVIAIGLLDIQLDPENEKFGYLSEDVVDSSYRGKGIAQQITQMRFEKARQLGCKAVEADVEGRNPIGLVTKLNDDFSVIDYNSFDNTFRIIKPAHNVNSGLSQQKTIYKEIAFSNVRHIGALLKVGWKGVDMKNIGDEKDNNPQDWIMILERPE